MQKGRPRQAINTRRLLNVPYIIYPNTTHFTFHFHTPPHSMHSLPQATIRCRPLHIKLPCAQHCPIHLQYTTLALNRLGEQKLYTFICHRTHMQIGDGYLETVLHRVLYLKVHINGIKKKKKKKNIQTRTKTSELL